MKKGEGRSHSWWWDSHISPKNSKWLQENLSEMDSKVNAMLKIIEEDADSFAQRAEMYYRKRPELIALVEDFYRTYRALVERYTFLTKEIRQNIAPALQAQLGITPESAQNSPIKRGIDGFDIVSPSYSYTGASEFDYDSPSEVSAKGNTDDELSPLGFATFNDRPFGSKAKFAGDHARRGGLDSGGLDISQLQKDLRHLQDENKAFASKSFEDAAKLKSLELELSNLQVRLRSLEADDKATKRKFKSVQEQEQKLEAENLKLNHALILAKEEKSDLVQQCNKKVEIACSRNKQLEDEVAALRKENLEIHAQALERLEHIQKAEESIQKVQTALASMEEQSRKESLVLRETIEQQSQEFRQKLLAIEEENAKLKQTEADANAMKELEDRLTKLITYRNDLEQLFLDSEKEKKICLEEKAAALAKIDELQRELDVVQTDKQSLSEQILQGGKEIETLKSIKCKLEDDIVRHEAVKLEGEKHITKLEEQIKEGNKIRDALTDQCRLCEERCKALEALEIQLRNELASVSAENAGLQEMKSTLEDGTEKANLHIKELQENVSSLASEKAVVVAELEKVREKLKSNDIKYCKLQQTLTEKEQKINKLDEDITTQLAHIKKLEDDLSTTLEEKASLEERENKVSQDLSDLQKEFCLLQNQLEEEHSHRARSLADHQGTVSKLQEDLSHHQQELKKLQHECLVKDEVIEKAKDQVDLLQEQLQKSKNDNKLLGNRNEEIVKQIADLESQIEYLKEKLSHSLAVNVSLADEVSEKGKMIELLNLELSSLRSQNIALTEDIALRTGHELGLQEQIKTLKEQIEFVHCDLQRSLEKRHTLESEIEKLQESSQKHAEAHKSLLDEQQKLFDELSLKKKNSDDLELKMKHLIREREQLVGEISTLKQSNEDLGIKTQKLTEERDQCLNEIRHMKKTSEDLESKINHAMKERSVFMTESASRLEDCTNLNNKIKTLENECQSLQAEKGSLEGMLERSEKEKKMLEKKLSDIERRLDEEMVNLQQAYHKVQETEGALVGEQQKHLNILSLMTKKTEQLEQNMVQLSEERDHLLKKVSECSKNVEDLQNDWQSAVKENQSLKETNDSLMTKLSDAEGRLVDETEKLRRACKIVEEKDAALRANLVQLSQERDQLLKDVSECSKKTDDLQNDWQSAMKENHSLKETNDSLMNKLSEAEGRLVDETEKLQQACKIVEEKDAALRANLKHLTDERTSLQKEVSVCLEECAAMKQKQMNLERDIELLQTENGSLKLVIASIEKEKDFFEKSNVDLTENFSEAKKGLEDLESRLSNALTENASLRDNVLLKENNITTLENKNLVLEKDVCFLQGQVSALKGREESLILDVSKRSEEIQTLNADIELLHNDIHERENKISKLESQYLDSQNKNEAFEKDVCSLQGQVSTMKGREESLLLDLTNRSVEIQTLNAEIELLHDGVRDKENIIANLEAELLASQNKNEALEKDVCSMQGHVSALKVREESLLLDVSKRFEEIQMLNADIELLHNNIHERENKISKLESQFLDSQNKNEALEKDVCSLQGQVSTMKGREESLLLDLTNRSVEIQTLNAEIELLHDGVRDKENIIANLEAELLASQNKNEALEKDACSMQGHVSALKVREESLLLDVSKRFEEIQMLNAEIELLRQAVNEKETKLSKLEAESLALQNNNQALEKDVLSLQGQVSTMKGREESILLDLTKRSEEIQTLNSEFKLLRDDVHHKENSIANLEAELLASQSKNEALDKDICNLQDQISAMKSSEGMLLLDLSKRSEEMQRLNAQTVLLQDDVHQKDCNIANLVAEILASQNKNQALDKDICILQDQVSSMKSQEELLLVELDKKSEEIQKLQTEIQLLRDRTSFMEKEIEELHEGIRCGHEEKSVLSRDIEMHSEISGALKLKIEKLEEEMQSKEKAAVLLENSLKEKLSKLESENTKLCDGIESQKVEIQKLTKAVTGLEEEKKSAVDRMELVIQEREMLDMKFSELHNKLDSANKKLHDSEDDLRNKVDDVKKLQEDVSKLEAAKLEAEKQLQFNSTVTKGYQEESEILKKMLADVQDECKKLEELYSQSMMDYEDAQKTILNCNQDLEKQRNDIEILKKEASSLDVVRIELEQALHHLNEEKVAQNTELEKIHEHLSCLQKEHDMSLHTIEALNLQLQEKEKSINELQEKLHVAEKHQVYMAEEQTRTNSDRDAKLKFLEKEIAHLKSENLQSSNKISAQHEDMIKLKDEYSTLQALRDSLQNERDISMKQVIEGQKDIQDMKAQIKEKEEENSKLALQIEELKQSLVHAEKEGANLSECLQQANDELDASKQIMKDEVSILHRDLSAKVSLISDMNAMVSSLENKRATLSEELTFKDETISDLQKKLSALEGDNKAMSMTSDSQAAEISSLKAALQELHDRLEKLATVADAREREVNQLHLQLDQVMEENKEAKEQIHCASEEVSQVKGEIKNLMIQVQSAQERYQKEHTKYNEAVAERDSFHEEFEKLKHTVAIHERAAEKVEEEMSSLYKIKNDMEVDVASMSRDLKESQVVSANLLKQIVSDLEDLIELLSSGQSVSVVGKSDNSLHIGEQLPSVTNGTNGKISGEEPQTSLISENFLDSLKDSDVAVKECGTEELSQEGLSLVIGDAIQRLKEKVLKLQEENRMLKITSENDHNDIEASLRELQIDFLRLEDERAHHNSEVSLYKSEINYLMHLLDGKCEHEESKAGHPEVRLLQDRLFDLRTKAVKMEEENMRLMKEMKTRKDEAGKSQEMLSDVESKCLRYAWQLKNNLVSCNGEVKFIAAELQNSSNKIDQVMMMQMERLTNWQKVNDGPSTIDLEKSASFNGIKKVSTSVIPLQLQDRLNESMWLLEALGVLKMMLTETLKKSIFRATDEAESLTVVDKQDPISSEERLSYSVTNYAESRYADIVSVEDSMKSVRKEGSEMQCEEPEEISLVQEHSEQSSPAEGENENNEECRLSQARANLGRRLYQAQMDEKLENELLELKEERRKLEEELRARVEQVEKMERELGNLQAQIKEGNEQQQSMDQRRQHLWLQKRRKVEIRASKIVDELVSQREQIRNLQDVVISWTKQQEVETGKLEKQVSVIVSHESNPTMDGWDDEQVNHLLKEMQTRKAWTRRHSLELKSVEKELRRVSSTIELTQKELMVREGGQAELNEEDESDDQEAEPQAGSLNTLSRTSSLSRRHRSRFRLHRFLLFIMPGKKGCLKGCFKRTRSSSHLSPRHSKPAASSSLAVTGKKLKCLTCVPCLKKPMTSEEH